ncbi:MAG: FAD-dependent oxidoreductase [Candidatus Latescibacteria bacterium]|jgi:hypothetical protein|nr:FAD-dependent oxidoreductase [Candidatus Latescibacterota bacterium]
MTEGKTIAVPAQEVAVSGEYDVVVCGGGPGGIGAAIAAARGGARTLLVEWLSSLGGIATGAYIGAWMDSPGGPIFHELFKTQVSLGSANQSYDPKRHHKPGRASFHPETMKAIALRMIRDAGADVLFCTAVEGAWLGDGRVGGVFVANKGGRSVVLAPVVIDTTADGDVAASAGAEYLKGDPEDGRLQHVNFKYQLEGIGWRKQRDQDPGDAEILSRIRTALSEGRLHPPTGVFRPCPETFPYHLPEKQLALAKWEIEGVDPTDPEQVSETLTECQLAAAEVVAFCREHLPGFEECRIGRFPGLLGTRESRRILGRYVLTRDDVLKARKFEDGISKACFFMDLHDSPPGITTAQFTNEFVMENRPPAGDWYEIPYRCLLPRDTRGLLMAGRCISSDRDAHGSLRVMPTCMFTGEAAGTAAAMAVAEGVLPDDLDGSQVREKMMVDAGVPW